jgi:hypothetical protein
MGLPWPTNNVGIRGVDGKFLKASPALVGVIVAALADVTPPPALPAERAATRPNSRRDINLVPIFTGHSASRLV